MLISVETEVFLSPAHTLVNTVNTAGVMSSGVSAEFKRFFPGAFSHYRSLCESGQLQPGRLFFYRADFRDLIHLPIKSHWRTTATAQALESGLQKLADTWADYGIHSLAITQFAEGELEWNSVVKPLLETYLAPLPIPVYLHRSDASDPRRSVRQIDQFLNLPAADVPIDRLWRDLGRVVRRVYGQFTASDGREVRIAQESGARFKRMLFTPDGEAPIAINESVLSEFWTMVKAAKLLLPAQFPGGLEAVAPYLLAVLAKTDYVRVVRAAIGDGPYASSLLYIPPPDTATHKLKFFPEASE